MTAQQSPKSGDVLVITSPNIDPLVPTGSQGVMARSDEDGYILVTFNPTAFHQSENNHTSCSGGPAWYVNEVDLQYRGQIVRHFQRWKADSSGPGRAGVFNKIVSAFIYTGPSKYGDSRLHGPEPDPLEVLAKVGVNEYGLTPEKCPVFAVVKKNERNWYNRVPTPAEGNWRHTGITTDGSLTLAEARKLRDATGDGAIIVSSEMAVRLDGRSGCFLNFEIEVIE